MITVVVNDRPRPTRRGETVADLLATLDVPPRGVAVAVNGEVVRRTDWPAHRLLDGDRVEVLTAVQGG
ncbi:thiamine biosynthesis protein ThiS [Catellatospora methionotrophica]|uniref:Thiamine biosynthesis protein ThiS n=1 Tax=Catellatospora methionotrophica TaxID=121620 RepID=A0A8J3LCS7_9ACTN|nr:sulfur carrier protein ThiS [Catellatospora methionotrophica]GIG13269.1 thiamine biosynthesis protein ThiS [Catellatospora methionotrophica]